MKRTFSICSILIVLAMLAMFVQPASAVHTLGFAAAVTYGVGTNPRSVAAGDLNKDGDLDLVTANLGSNNVSVLQNNGSGGFSAAATYGVGASPWSVAIGYLDNDTYLDLVTANNNNNNVSVLLNNGLGGFPTAVPYSVGTGPMSVTAGDLDGDGDLDLATANWGGSVSVLMNNGSGGFGAATPYTVGTNPRFVAAGDLDGDGDLDLVTANSSSYNVSVLLNNGSGVFSAAGPYGVGALVPSSVTAGDLDGDGDLDLATANSSSNNASVLMNNGSGVFGTAATYPVGTSPRFVAAGDLDGDGDLDLVTANFDSGNVSLLLNDGSGAFGAATPYTVGTNPVSVIASDLDGDSDLDLVAANYNSNNVSVLLSTSTIEIFDTTGGTATRDGTIYAGEYVGFTYGINSGFGGVIGAGSTLHVDSSSTGDLNIGLIKGPGAFNDLMVIYIDVDGGGSGGGVGFTGTSTFNDTGSGGDPCRKAISGYDGTYRATLNFASGFKADYAVCLDHDTVSPFAGLWKLVDGDGPHDFITSLNLWQPIVNGHYEMELTLANLGLAPGASFDYVATYISDTASRSDEFNGVASFPPGNPGQNTTVGLAAGDYHTFISYHLEASPANNGGNGPGGVGYTDGTSSLELWLRGDKGVTTSSGSVSTWADQSGNSAHVTQGTGNNQPLHVVNQLNGLPIVRFSGGFVGDPNGDYLNIPTSVIQGQTAFSFFTAFKWNGGDYWQRLWDFGSDTTKYGFVTTQYGAMTPRFSITASGNTHEENLSFTTTLPTGSGQIIDVIWGVPTGTSWRNGGSEGSGSGYSVTPASLGSITQHYIGKSIWPDPYLEGDMGEFIVFSSALPDVERILVDNYLSARYNVALSANDVYDGDTNANGEFDFGVAGIGRTGGVSHTQAHSDGMIVRNVTFLQGNGDWLLFGHTAALNGNTTGDLPTGGDWPTAPDPMRWARSFYIDLTDEATVTGGSVDIIFDFSEGSMGGAGNPVPAGPASNYRLLKRSGATGAFTDITAASGARVAIVGDQVQFLGVDVSLLGSNFTVATRDYNNSPTSVEILDLSARQSASLLPIALLSGAAVLVVTAGLLLRRKAR